MKKKHFTWRHQLTILLPLVKDATWQFASYTHRERDILGTITLQIPRLTKSTQLVCVCVTSKETNKNKQRNEFHDVKATVYMHGE